MRCEDSYCSNFDMATEQNGNKKSKSQTLMRLPSSCQLCSCYHPPQPQKRVEDYRFGRILGAHSKSLKFCLKVCLQTVKMD